KKFLDENGISGSPVILFLGRMNPLKGPQHLLEIAPEILKKFPDAAFVFVGPDQSGYSEKLQEMAKIRDLKAYFTGPIYDFEKKMQAYASCDLFVLPTSYEGTSQAIFEAMSQARPIVSTSVGGIPSQISSGKEGLLVPYGDQQALKEVVIKLLEDKNLASTLGQAAREKVRSFTYPVLASKLLEIYEELIQT
ncbi:MAG: glycosyltransferase family 4 protein, partial [Nitrososphaerota archaeon]|nr:glycosyltransferase family 4 protein [Nitrososphaerota archaeon]